ncbi:MAG: hypothetical protein F4Y12_06595 [Acidimicrobiaceae bacterium]|nr:hypothetical protein [Acidimicrobiaceae bacterium]
MSPTKQSEPSPEPSSYQPTILPASTVNRGFIPERRKHRQPSAKRLFFFTPKARLEKKRRAAHAQFEKLRAEREEFLEIHTRQLREIHAILRKTHDALAQRGRDLQRLGEEGLEYSSLFEEAATSAGPKAQEANEASDSRQVEAE